MPLPIAPVVPVTPLNVTAAVRPESIGAAGSFQAIFQNALQQVEGLRQQAAGLTQDFLGGEGGELQNGVLATQQSELAFEMFQQVRNKVVQAYQEVMRMQL